MYLYRFSYRNVYAKLHLLSETHRCYKNEKPNFFPLFKKTQRYLTFKDGKLGTLSVIPLLLWHHMVSSSTKNTFCYCDEPILRNY